MKPLLCLCLILGLVNVLFGQVEWVSSTINSPTSHKFIKLKNDAFAILSRDVYVIDSLGEQQFYYGGTSGFNSASPVEIERFPSGELLLGELWYYPGHLGVDFYGYSDHYSEEWTVNYFWNQFDNIKALSDSTYFFFFYGGNEIDIQYPDSLAYIHLEYDIEDIIVTALDTVIITYEQGIDVYDRNLALAYHVPNPAFTKIKEHSDGGYVATDENILYLLDDLFQINHQLDFGGAVIKDFYVENSFLAVLTDEPRVYIYQYPFNIYSQFSPQEDCLFHSVSISGDRIMLAGATPYGVSEKGHHASFIKSYTFQGNTSYSGQDARLVEVSFDHIDVNRKPYPAATSDTLYEVSFSNLKAQIKNEGQHPLDEVTLWATFPFYYVYLDWYWATTFPQQKKMHFTNLNLMPGESIEVHWDLNYWANIAPETPYSKCFWLATPNGFLDHNRHNDYACADGEIINSNKAIVLNESYKAFPNPFINELLLELKDYPLSSPLQVDIFNAVGELVHKSNVQSSKLRISTTNWAKGVYFLEVKAGGKIIGRKKILKH